jgi:long-chain acyl-CoA synthetase
MTAIRVRSRAAAHGHARAVIVTLDGPRGRRYDRPVAAHDEQLKRLAPEQIGYVAADCDARIAVLDGAAELARWQPVLDQLPGLTTIIVRDPVVCPAGDRYLTWDGLVALGRDRLAADPGEITARAAAIEPGDPLALLYTSGTTGNPKGVVLTHRNILYEMAAAERMGIIVSRVRWVSYLPLAHIAERMFSIYLAIGAVSHVHFCPDPAQLVRVIGQVRPTAFFGVPRVWEKIRAGIQALLTAEQDEAKRAAMAQAMDIGARYVHSCQYGQARTPELAAQFRAADERVLGPIRGLLGLGEAVSVFSAAAPLPPDVAAFFAGLGMTILDVYGMTETTGAFTANTPAEFKLGTVGRPYAGIEVAIAGDGEILARGPLATCRGGRRSHRSQSAAGPGAAGQAVAPAARGMDRRDRGTHPHPQAQAPRRACQVRRHHRLPLHTVIPPRAVDGQLGPGW